jgi:pyrroline-5-carboxylate reductase
MSKPTIGLLGAGYMAEALLGGWLESSLCEPSSVIAADLRPERLAELRERHGIRTTTKNEELVHEAEVIVLAVKPQVVASVLEPLASELKPEHLLISVAAGVPIIALETLCSSGTRIIRTMPNTPALIREGATALAAGHRATTEDVALAQQLFDALGLTVVVPESQFDAVTGLSGSGPAFVMLFIESLADGGVRAGLPRDVALALATQTVLGSARLVASTGEHPGVLKDRVTSPAGTTIFGVAALERGAFRSSVIAAVTEAAERSAELGRTR